jgi:hypothetical protein
LFGIGCEGEENNSTIATVEALKFKSDRVAHAAPHQKGENE